MRSKEDEIRYLIYLKSELIKQQKKEIKELNQKLKDIEGQKRLYKKRGEKK